MTNSAADLVQEVKFSHLKFKQVKFSKVFTRKVWLKLLFDLISNVDFWSFMKHSAPQKRVSLLIS